MDQETLDLYVLIKMNEVWTMWYFLCTFWDEHVVLSSVAVVYHIDQFAYGDILVNLARIPLAHGVWSFLCVIGFEYFFTEI